jgi:hypothetical protein
MGLSSLRSRVAALLSPCVVVAFGGLAVTAALHAGCGGKTVGQGNEDESDDPAAVSEGRRGRTDTDSDPPRSCQCPGGGRGGGGWYSPSCC